VQRGLRVPVGIDEALQRHVGIHTAEVKHAATGGVSDDFAAIYRAADAQSLHGQHVGNVVAEPVVDLDLDLEVIADLAAHGENTARGRRTHRQTLAATIG